nr:hypothetical protein [Streptomyces sp. DSM 41633]
MLSAESLTIADAAGKLVPTVGGFLLGLVTGNWRRIWRWIGRKDPVGVYVESNPEIIYANSPDWVSFPQFVPLDRHELSAPPNATLALWSWAKGLGGSPAWMDELQIT